MTTAADATFALMAENIDSIVTLSNGSADANATAGQILTGYSAYVKGSKINGSMTNQGAKTSTLNCGKSYTIPAGYHNGSGKITANSLASQTSATATAEQILSGKTAWVNGNKITGTAVISDTHVVLGNATPSESIYSITGNDGSYAHIWSGLPGANISQYSHILAIPTYVMTGQTSTSKKSGYIIDLPVIADTYVYRWVYYKDNKFFWETIAIQNVLTQETATTFKYETTVTGGQVIVVFHSGINYTFIGVK